MNIFIAKLSPATSSEDLESLFANYGEVKSAKVIIDRETGKSKCFGFVEMAEESASQQAIEALDGTEFQDKTIVVKKSLPKSDDNRGGGGNGFRKPFRR